LKASLIGLLSLVLLSTIWYAHTVQADEKRTGISSKQERSSNKQPRRAQLAIPGRDQQPQTKKQREERRSRQENKQKKLGAGETLVPPDVQQPPDDLEN
jgi:hypothetical protein